MGNPAGHAVLYKGGQHLLGLFGPWTPSELVQNYNPDTMNGVWIWYDPVDYTINFTADEDAQGSMTSVRPIAKEDYGR